MGKIARGFPRVRRVIGGGNEACLVERKASTCLRQGQLPLYMVNQCGSVSGEQTPSFFSRGCHSRGHNEEAAGVIERRNGRNIFCDQIEMSM